MKKYRSAIARTVAFPMILLMLKTSEGAASAGLRVLLVSLIFFLAIYFVYAVWAEAVNAKKERDTSKWRLRELLILKWVAPLAPLTVVIHACFAYIR